MTGDDRLLAPTLWTARLIVPVLVAAWAILYLFPGETERLWAWTVRPPLTAMVMGAGYLAGAYFFTRVVSVGSWHRVGWGFVATTVFTTLLLLATLLHWDRFNHGHVSFWAWLGLYLVTPPLLPLLFARNRRHDPGRRDADDVTVPRSVRVAVATAGAAQLTFALVLFVRPTAAMDRWVWPLTPLTARTLSAFLAFLAVLWLCFLFDDRWSSFEIPMQTVTLGLVLVAVATVLERHDFTGPTAAVRAFPWALGAAIVLLVALQVAMRRRLPAGRAAQPPVQR
ncbi:MAG: hypothetical protein KY454_14295 [Actinobacteria bacterium]|nr:hypothetical protein [Actinomycetota bacterium]